MGGLWPDRADAAAIERRAAKIGDPVARLRYLRRATAAPPCPRRRWRWMILALGAVLAASGGTSLLSSPTFRPPAPAVRPAAPAPPPPNVWLVEKTPEYEVYSNGLRIEDSLAVANEPRTYSLVSRSLEIPAGPRRTAPAGIVFHATESDQAPFAPDQNRQLQRIGKELLLFVRNKRAYHFVIDRFGRVHRIVVESDAANHAGHSIWADSRWVYLNLNASFLGVAFEAGRDPVNDAQLHAARVLTDMLRARYNLPPENCVTHAQVSVNPDNQLIGWHTDGGAGFPFRALGLPDNYGLLNPSLYLFGFHYDAAYLKATDPAVWKALALSEQRLRDEAAARALTVAEYRKVLFTKYRDEIAALRQAAAGEENVYESN